MNKLFLFNFNAEDSPLSFFVAAPSEYEATVALKDEAGEGATDEEFEETVKKAKVHEIPAEFKFVTENEQKLSVLQTAAELADVEEPGIVLTSDEMKEIPTSANVQKLNRAAELLWLKDTAVVDAPKELLESGQWVFDLSEAREVKAGGFTLGTIKDLRPAPGFMIVVGKDTHVCPGINEAMGILYDRLTALQNQTTRTKKDGKQLRNG